MGLFTLYNTVRASRATNNFRASMADMVVLGGFLGLASCQGPLVPFTPGRRDAAVPNSEGLLPGSFDDAALLMDSASRMGLSAEEYTLLIGMGHSVSNPVGAGH